MTESVAIGVQKDGSVQFTKLSDHGVGLIVGTVVGSDVGLVVGESVGQTPQKPAPRKSWTFSIYSVCGIDIALAIR